jgi:putative ABC transport system permease protein
VKQGLSLAVGGIACGILLAFAATRMLQSLLFHVSSTDPLTYLTACIALCGAAVMASYLPSRRTAGVNPVEALRSE